jgi:protein SCO1/2
MNQRNQSLNLIIILLVSLTAVFALPLMAEEQTNAEQQNAAPQFTRTVANYVTPDVTVVRADSKKLSFSKELDDGRPVIMNFIFASCSAICPMLSHVFAKVQTKLEKDSQNFHLVSISIDPENDTPAKLSEYAKKFGAGPNWNFYTGTVETSIAIQKAFNIYRGDKMNHSSTILMRYAPGKPWSRLEGFVSPDAVISEYRN